MKKIGFVILCVMMLTAFFFISNIEFISTDSEEYSLPEDGKWINQEGNIIISFDKDDPYSTIVINGYPISCSLSKERYSPDVFLNCEEVDNPLYSDGDIVFYGKITNLQKDSFTIVTYENGKSYTFRKIEDGFA